MSRPLDPQGRPEAAGGDAAAKETARTILEGGAARAEGAGGLGLERYRDAVEFAQGGMGSIFRATDTQLERPVAIKVAHRSRDRRASELLLREARIAGGLQHPSIPPIHEVGRTRDGRPFFAMKLIEGRSLAEILVDLRGAARGRRSFRERLRLLPAFLKICEGVAYAHSRGVVHRDLKPDNVMVGAFGEVLILDWGIATEERGGGGLDGAVAGTLGYMAPEQAAGREGEIGPRSDVYALGAILYEILALSPPFRGRTLAQLRIQMDRWALDPPSARDPEAGIPAELDAVVLRAIARSPDERYPDPEALKADLEAFLEGRTLSAVRYGLLERAAKWVRRHRTVAVAVACSFAIAAVLAIGFGWHVHRERRARVEEALAEAERAVAAVPALDDLGSTDPGAAWRTARIDAALAAHLDAAIALERARAHDPDDARIVRRRLEVGLALGRIAIRGGDFTLARHAFRELATFGAGPGEVDAWLAEVEAARTEVLTRRATRLAEILADLGEGLGRPDRDPTAPLLEELVDEALRFDDDRSASIVAAALEGLVEKARREGAAPAWRQEERDLSTFACRVLGQSARGRPGCLDALAAWFGAVLDPELAVEAGLALGRTREPRAIAALVEGLDRFDPSSLVRRRLDAALARIDLSRIPDAPTRTAEDGYAFALVQATRDPERAISLLGRTIALDPGLAKAYHLRGLLRQRQGQLELALEDLDRAVALDPDQGIFFERRGLVREEAGDHAGALADLDRAVELEPSGAILRSSRAAFHKRRGDLARALADYTEAIELQPRFPEALSNRSEVRQGLGDLRGALEDLDRAIALDPDRPETWLNRGRFHQTTGDLETAILDYGEAIARRPRYAMAYRNRGRLHYRRGERAAALVDLDAALAIEPDDAPANRDRAGIRWEVGDREGALADLGRAIELEPSDTAARITRGNMRHALGDVAGACEDYSAAIDLGASDHVAFHRRALHRIGQGDLAGAESDLDRAIEIPPVHADCLHARARIRFERGDPAGAAEDFARVAALEPGDWGRWFELGQVLEHLGRLGEARAALARALEICPPQARDQVREVLARCGG